MLPCSNANHLQNVSSLSNQYYALRHGQSKANKAGIISSDPAISTVQHGLTDIGKNQVHTTARKFCEEYFLEQSKVSCDHHHHHHPPAVAIYSSDFTRARETACIFAQVLQENNIPLLFKDRPKPYCDATSTSVCTTHKSEKVFGVKFDTRLRERYFGQFNGQSDSHYQNVWDVDRTDADHTEYDVESVNSVMKRTSDLVLDIESSNLGSKNIISAASDNGDGNRGADGYTQVKVILVAHGDVLQILQTAFLKKDGSVHRSLEHLNTAGVRELKLGDS